MARELGLLNGEYLWIWLGDFDFRVVSTQDKVLQQLLVGSLHTMSVEGFVMSDADPFLTAWHAQNATLAQP